MEKRAHISIQRRNDAYANFEKKVRVLEALQAEGNLTSVPESLSLSAFAAWENHDLGIVPLSRAAFYSATDEHKALRQRVADALKRIADAQKKEIKRNSRIKDLENEIKQLKERATCFAGQYSTAAAELRESKLEIIRLNETIKRMGESKGRVTNLRPER